MFERKLRRLRRVGYGWLVLQGIVSAVAPRVGIRLGLRGYAAAFENVGDLEPREWYVDAARATGAGMVVTGLVGLFLEDRREAAESGNEAGRKSGNETNQRSESGGELAGASAKSGDATGDGRDDGPA